METLSSSVLTFFAPKNNKMTVEEILKFGLEVFNGEEDKFNSWLDKRNISLGGNKPRILLLSDKGCREVLACLYRVEFGNFA